MYLDATLIGAVGDLVPVTQYHHTLSVEMRNGLSAVYDIALDNGSITVNPVSQSACLGATSWMVVPDAVARVHRSDGEFSVTLTTPRSQFEGMCSLELPIIPCYMQQARVHLGTVPRVDAEVWIDGIFLQTTADEVRVPYCAGMTPPVSFTLRKNGYVPCQATLDFSTELNAYDLTCTLQRYEANASK
jgi:hypothetical protein